MPKVLTGTERSEIACPKDSPTRWPHRGQQMRIVSLIDQEDVIERILRHLGLWQEGCVHSSTDPWAKRPRSVARGSLPDYDTEGGCRRVPATRKSPCLTSGPLLVTLRPWKRTLSASDSRPTPQRAESDILSVFFFIFFRLFYIPDRTQAAPIPVKINFQQFFSSP